VREAPREAAAPSGALESSRGAVGQQVADALEALRQRSRRGEQDLEQAVDDHLVVARRRRRRGEAWPQLAEAVVAEDSVVVV
jgi:hypothetical protein